MINGKIKERLGNIQLTRKNFLATHFRQRQDFNFFFFGLIKN